MAPFYSVMLMVFLNFSSLVMVILFYFWRFKIGSNCDIQSDLKLVSLLHQCPECWIVGVRHRHWEQFQNNEIMKQ